VQQLDRTGDPGSPVELHEQICTRAHEIAQAAPPLTMHQRDVIRRCLGQSSAGREE